MVCDVRIQILIPVGVRDVTVYTVARRITLTIGYMNDTIRVERTKYTERDILSPTAPDTLHPQERGRDGKQRFPR